MAIEIPPRSASARTARTRSGVKVAGWLVSRSALKSTRLNRLAMADSSACSSDQLPGLKR